MFRFNLQTVLDYRAAKEQEAYREYSEGQRRLEEEHSLLESIRRQKEESRQKINALTGKAVESSMMSYVLEEIRYLVEWEARQEKIVEQAADKVESKRMALLTTMKEKKALELLKSKREEEYKATMSKRERKAADEKAVQKYEGNKT